MQGAWGWGASLLNLPFSGSNDPMGMFGLGEAAPSGPAPEQDFFGLAQIRPAERPAEETQSTAASEPRQVRRVLWLQGAAQGPVVFKLATLFVALHTASSGAAV